MMDLAERLRKLGGLNLPILDRAADEIERLTLENDRLTREAKRAERYNADLTFHEDVDEWLLAVENLNTFRMSFFWTKEFYDVYRWIYFFQPTRIQVHKARGGQSPVEETK